MRPTMLLLALAMVPALASGQRFSQYSIDALRAHNKRRSVPLKLDMELCKSAQAHADKMASQDGLSYHDMNDLTRTGQGENLHFVWTPFGWSHAVTAEEAVKAW